MDNEIDNSRMLKQIMVELNKNSDKQFREYLRQAYEIDKISRRILNNISTKRMLVLTILAFCSLC